MTTFPARRPGSGPASLPALSSAGCIAAVLARRACTSRRRRVISCFLGRGPAAHDGRAQLEESGRRQQTQHRVANWLAPPAAEIGPDPGGHRGRPADPLALRAAGAVEGGQCCRQVASGAHRRRGPHRRRPPARWPHPGRPSAAPRVRRRRLAPPGRARRRGLAEVIHVVPHQPVRRGDGHQVANPRGPGREPIAGGGQLVGIDGAFGFLKYPYQ